PSDIFNSPSTSSWREDVPKIFDQLQILRSRSYKKTVHPPLSREISHDLIERMSRMSEFDRSRSQTISVQQMPTDGLQKVIRKQRTNLASVRAFNINKKEKKINMTIKSESVWNYVEPPSIDGLIKVTSYFLSYFICLFLASRFLPSITAKSPKKTYQLTGLLL
ncbi:unnamed protein product, partial [Adineta steineri]